LARWKKKRKRNFVAFIKLGKIANRTSNKQKYQRKRENANFASYFNSINHSKASKVEFSFRRNLGGAEFRANKAINNVNFSVRAFNPQKFSYCSRDLKQKELRQVQKEYKMSCSRCVQPRQQLRPFSSDADA